MITDVISISTEEYKDLVAKATRYDQLRRIAERANYLTDFERAVFEIPVPEPTKDESEGEANEAV